MSALTLLLRNVPPWVEIEEQRGNRARITASPPLEGGKPTRDFFLELRPSSSGGVAVFEQEAKRQFPEFCLERHINPDSSFCVFYGSEHLITDDAIAEQWWSHLSTYLNNQIYAGRFEVWPQGSGLSHGDAADEQIAMEELADPLGWKEEIWEGMFRRTGWLAEKLPRISKDAKRVVNARSPCPRGCTKKHKLLRSRICEKIDCYPGCKRSHKAVLRAECPHRDSIELIILHEHRRRKMEEQIVSKLFRDGRGCCGTMKHCALRDMQEREST